MALQYVSSGAGTGTSLSPMPTHQAGDLLIMFAHRNNNQNAPSTASGWSDAGTTGSGASNSCRVATKVAASSAETSGTWSNATSLVCVVYRNAAYGGNIAFSSSSVGTSPEYPALTLNDPGTSWVLRFCGMRTGGGAANPPANVPSGFTNRANATTGGSTVSWSMDTNGPSDNVSSASQAVTFSFGWCTVTMEITDNTPPATPPNQFFAVL